LSQPDSVNEVTDVLLYFSGKELVKSSGTEVVHEFLDLVLVLRESEGEMDVDIYVGVVLSWASVDWGVIVNDVFGEHAGNSPPAWVEPLGTGVHDTF